MLTNKFKNTFCLLCCFLSLLIFDLSAQNYYSTSVSGPLNPSPTASSYGKFTDAPVNPSNGTMNVSIPIESLTEGTLRHNVSLDYHTGGLRVSEISSDVGLGWHLNAGGIISRTVRGLPDDCVKGYYKRGYYLNGSTSEQLAAAEGKLDTEPDLFYYNVNGISGKFIFDKNKNVRCIPQSDVRIIVYRHNGFFMGFRLTTPDGTNYYFGQKPLAGESQIHTIGDQDSFTESWFLHRIDSFDGKHFIKFEYVDNDYAYPMYPDCYVSAYWNNGLKTCKECDEPDRIIRVKGKSLKKIITSTKQISFDHLADRLDLHAYYAPTTNTPKPKRIFKINVQNGPFCYFYFLEQSYFQSNGTSYGVYDLDKRLRLDRVKKYSCNGQLIEEPYIIDYYSNDFPSVMDKGIDHWGFSNGVHGNNNKDDLIPLSEVEINGQTYTYGSASRYSLENPMLKGSLKKITFPTKGSAEYTFEANEYSDFQASGSQVNLFTKVTCPLVNGQFVCCNGPISNQNTLSVDHYQIINQEQINTGILSLKIALDPSNNNCIPPPNGGSNHSASLEIYDQTLGGVYLSSYNINFVYDAGIKEEESIDLEVALLEGINAGHNYKFKLSSVNGLGSVKIDYDPNFQVNKTAGGLRVKEVKTHDGISSLNDIKRTFTYKLNAGFSESSGALISKPNYAFKVNSNTALFSSSSIRSLTSSNGMHITYRRVLESFNGNGHNEYLLDHEKYSYGNLADYPAFNGLLLNKNGFVKEKRSLDNSNKVVAKTEFTPENNSYEYAPGYIYATKSIKVRNQGSCQDEFLKADYKIRTATYRPHKIISTIDGIKTERKIFYYNNDRVLNPQRVEFTNSDGKVNKTTYKYTVDYNLTAGLKAVFLHRYMIGIPYESLYYVDNILLDAVRNFYSNYKSNGQRTTSLSKSYFPRPYYIKRYEITWDNGILQPGIWKDKEIFVRYNGYGLLSKYRKNAWSYTDYLYNAQKQLTSSKYGNHIQSYEYYPSSSVLKKTTAVNGNSTSYVYDDLMRLISTKDDCQNITTSYEYELNSTNIIDNKNYVETKVSFPVSPNSNLTTLVNRKYIDGLGRNIQTVRLKQSPNSKDFLISKKYDKYGRVLYDYKIKESSFDDGRYVAPLPNWLRTSYSYYNNPLNREYTVKAPNWHNITFSYGGNTISDLVKNHSTNTNFEAGALSKRIVSDLNGRKQIKFYDKKGREILSRQSDSNDNPNQRLDSYSIYDNKDRVVYMLPPGVSNTSATNNELFFKYSYNGNDLLSSKKTPGVGLIEYKYNDRYQLGAYQDPHLKDQNKWYTYHYDSFGRKIEEGFYNGTPNGNFQPDELLQKNTFGTTASTIDKIVKVETKVLGTNDWLSSNSSYDGCGILISQIGNNHVNLNFGAFTSNNVYDGLKNVLKTTTSISAFGINKTIQNRQVLDEAGRMIENYFKVDNQAEKQISAYEYNAEEELARKYQGRTGLSGNLSFLQKIDFTYLDNGLIKKINENNLTGAQQAIENCNLPNPIAAGTTYDQRDLWYQELYYDTKVAGTDASIQYNGNLANVVYQVRGREQGIYSNNYDQYNRLKQSTYYDRQNGNLSNSGRYSSAYNYDERGNLTSLQRNGMYPSGACYLNGQIDNLNFNYFPNSNQLKKVTDIAPSISKNAGFKDGASGDHLYDANGNLTADKDKKIEITYNHLNLPKSIEFTNSNKSIDFVYDALGNLLTKKVKTGSNVDEQRDYLNGIEFLKLGNATTKLNFIQHPEGRVFYPKNGAPRYEYTISDHQGNARLCYTDKNGNGKIETPTEIQWEGHYYPFGMQQDASWMRPSGTALRHTYNGIESLEDHGLALNLAKFRTLDPSIARWWQVDPKGESYNHISPYASMNLNPMVNTDPNGDLVETAFLVSSLVSVGTNGVINSLTGNQFFDGWLAAAIGGLTASDPANAALGVLISKLPSKDFQFFPGYVFNVGPTAKIGTEGLQVGLSVSAKYQSGDFVAGISKGFLKGKNTTTNETGHTNVEGIGLSYHGAFYASIWSTTYDGGGIGQTTATYGVGGDDIKFHYENDWQPLIFILTDRGDRFRTAAGRISFGDYSVGFNLFTGDSGPYPRETRDFSIIDGEETYDSKIWMPDKYRLGAAYFGYKNARVGWNSENIRHIIQNKFAHDLLMSGDSKWFRILKTEFPDAAYGGYFRNTPYSLWE